MPQELPRLSSITEKLMAPEAQFEAMVERATGFRPPPGPQSVLFSLQRSFEAGRAPELPRLGLPSPPRLEAVLERLPRPPAVEEAAPAAPSRPAEERAPVF